MRMFQDLSKLIIIKRLFIFIITIIRYHFIFTNKIVK